MRECTQVLAWQGTGICSTDVHQTGGVAVQVTGSSVYSKLKWEAGVHRVQRVPATEGSGRIHTSTATVAGASHSFWLRAAYMKL